MSHITPVRDGTLGLDLIDWRVHRHLPHVRSDNLALALRGAGEGSSSNAQPKANAGEA